MDYCFLRNKAGEDYEPVLVGKDKETRMFFAHVVPCKGADVEWVAKQVAKDLIKLGIHGEVKLRGDQEPALQDLFKAIARERGSLRTQIEASPKGDSSGNGTAERAVQSVEEMVRVLKINLERRLGSKLEVTHKIFPWLVEHVVDLLNKYVVSLDGKSAYHRLKGKAYNSCMYEFCTPVMFRVSGKVQGGILAERWYEGTWIGKRMSTEEHYVLKADGLVVRCRAVRERAVKLELKTLDKIVSVPWNPTGTSKEDEGVPIARNIVDADGEPKGMVPRGIMITPVVLQRFGSTADCGKCRSIARGEPNRSTNHSAACRTRIETAMREDDVYKEKLEKCDEKRNRYLAEKLESDMKVDPPEGGNGESASSSASSDQPQSQAQPVVEVPKPPEAQETPNAEDDAGDAGDNDMADDIPLATEATMTDVAPVETEEPVERDPKRSRIELVEDCEFDVGELYSAPRMCTVAHDKGLKAGWSIDKCANHWEDVGYE